MFYVGTDLIDSVQWCNDQLWL